MGCIIPDMGTSKRATRPPAFPSRTSVADALFTKGQQRVLGVLFGNPGRSFYANEIIARAGAGTGAVQRELARLEGAGLVKVTHLGRQKHYQANPGSPVFAPLRELVLKTSGLADVLRGALAPVATRIRAAFVYGSVATGEDTATSDVDLMVISEELTYADLFALLEKARKQIGRPVNPTVYSPGALRKRIHTHKAFVTRVLAKPKIWLIGGENDLSAR